MSVRRSHILQQRFFKVREYAKQLSEKKGELFLLVVKKLLFIMKSSRPDLETAVYFLTTRVSKSDFTGWGKLIRIFRFVHDLFRPKIPPSLSFSGM